MEGYLLCGAICAAVFFTIGFYVGGRYVRSVESREHVDETFYGC